TDMIENLRTYIENEMSKNKIVGLSIAVVDTNGILLSEGFGKADKENKVVANSATLFPIASVTKTFTGIAVMQLVEKGLIDLDKPIADYIPELSLPMGEEKIITTRMLLTHHSGIHGDILYNWYLPDVSKNLLIYEQVVPLINEVGTIFPPGKLHSYCNAGYSLLGVLIHKVSGIGYADYIRSNIFDPLEMDNSIVFAGEPTNNFIAKGYIGKVSTSMPMKLGIPAGGIVLSANDAAKYLLGVIGSYHGNFPLLKQETMKQMMTQQNKNVELDRGFSMGLTWFLQDPINEVTIFSAHRGELPPYHSMMIILPELKIGLFISINTNKAASVPDELAHKIIRDLYEYHKGNAMPQIKTENKISLSPEHLKQYEGVYPNVYFGPMTVKLRGKELVVKSPVMPISLVLTPHVDKTFTMKARMLGIHFSVKMLNAMKVEFRENKEEKYMYFNIQNSLLNPNLKIEPFEIPLEYFNYKGKYKVVNMQNSDRVVKDVKIKINKKGEFSIFKYTFLGRHKFNITIEPVDKQNAKFAGVGYFVGDKIRWEKKDNKVLMYWSGLKLEKK
ncbi:MAG: serine hydrolase, partial [Bacteroidales bacterium]|nr:serine hydrolase [Bacteroidales bacterium]